MSFAKLKTIPLGLFLLLAALIWSGCGRASERLDRRDERDPQIMRGDARKRAGDIDGAIEMYVQALDRKPNLALAHLKLAVEYDEYKRDHLRAIFHYSRYLELRPAAQKNELVEELIRMAHVSYLASLPNPPPGAIEKIAMQERENARLRSQVEDLINQVRALEARLAGQQSRPAPAQPSRTAETTPSPVVRPQPEPAQPPARTYRVERGDTLSRIAGKVYNDSSQWNQIYEANRNILSTPQSLREGQTLMIP